MSIEKCMEYLSDKNVRLEIMFLQSSYQLTVTDNETGKPLYHFEDMKLIPLLRQAVNTFQNAGE